LRLKRTVGSALNPDEVDSLTVTQWLTGLGQSHRIQERLWDPLSLGILNERPEIASATGFAQALKRMLEDKDGVRLGLSRLGLSDLYAEAACRFIEAKGGNFVALGHAVELIEDKGRVRGAILASGERCEAEAVISALPPWDLAALKLPESIKGPWMGLKGAPIIGISLWLRRPLMGRELVAGLLGTEVQWLFNKTRILGLEGDGLERNGEYVSAVISGAHRELSLKPEELLKTAVKDIASCFGSFDVSWVRRWKVIKEPRATLSPVPGSEAMRPAPGSGMPGFYFAGDWTRTGLPATIESAVMSGHLAAQAVLNKKEISYAQV
jgi:hypothetical protein